MYDAIIVGARCAGVATAIFLAQRGHRVLLLDRATFPSGTISTHTFGEKEIFRRLGVLAEIEGAGAPPLTRMHVDLEGCIFEADLVIAERALGLRREQLDAILVRRAAAFPTVDFRPGHAVIDLLQDQGTVIGVVFRDPAGREHRARGRVVVGADGWHSGVARRVGAEAYLRSAGSRCAYYTYFTGLAPLAIPAVEWYWWAPGIIFVTRCEPDLHCALVMPPLEEFAEWRRRPEALLLARLMRIRTLAPRLRSARRAGPVLGMGSLVSFLRRPYGPGWALVGDAGAHVHPVQGAGIDDALLSAEWLAEALDQWFRHQGGWAELLAAYQERRDARVRPEIEAAARNLQRSRGLPADGPAWLRLVSTLPSAVHDLAERGADLARFALGEARFEMGRPLVEKMLGTLAPPQLAVKD